MIWMIVNIVEAFPMASLSCELADECKDYE